MEAQNRTSDMILYSFTLLKMLEIYDCP